MSKNKPNPIDFCNVSSLLSDDERKLQLKMAAFVNEKVIPYAGKSFDSGVFPKELISDLAGLDVLGCKGLNHVSYGLICQELERGDTGVRTFVSVQCSLVMQPISDFGSKAQQEKWLPLLASGRAIGCFALTEEQGGSDLANMQTQAIKDGDDWIITGKKVWITNGSIADIAVVWAMTDEGCRAFIVEKGTEGFSTSDIERKYSLRASVTSNLMFEGVRVPRENMLPNVNGLAGPLRCLTNARYGIAWGAVGAAIACFEEVLAYTKDRDLFGKPLAATQSIQMRLAEMSRKISTAQLLVLHLGRMKDAGTLHHSQISMAKWNNVRVALDIARDARDMLGANGVSSEYCTIRHMLNLETVITYEGTETVHQLVVGRELTDLNAF
ncbi:MAG: acyl-CoA dehydrogenase family protein [Planctomycetes bacterium]|nr:acyl-CoA dehydrogenase family protein [Planctomycetota bacterium]